MKRFIIISGLLLALITIEIRLFNLQHYKEFRTMILMPEIVDLTDQLQRTLQPVLRNETENNLVVIHHTGELEGNCTVFSANQYHINKGWGSIAYHYFITSSGMIIQTKNLNEIGNHTEGYNDKSIGIVLQGNFDRYPPGEAQMKNLEKLIKWLKVEYPISDVQLHKELNRNTDCPGKYFELKK